LAGTAKEFAYKVDSYLNQFVPWLFRTTTISYHIGVLRIPEEFYLYKDKDKEESKKIPSNIQLVSESKHKKLHNLQLWSNIRSS
jgi:hypothetical protein